MDNTAVSARERGELIAVAVCPHCHVINKLRSADNIEDGKCKCQSCGEEITIEKTIRK